jgi:hypothetical protein
MWRSTATSSNCATHGPTGIPPRVSIDGGPPFGYDLTAVGGVGACVAAMASDGGSRDLPEGQTVSVSLWLGPKTGSEGKAELDTYFLNDH